MLHAEVTVELPDASLSPPSTISQLVDRLMDRRGDEEDVRNELLDGLTQLHGFLQAFAEAGFDDVLSVVVDGRSVYVDVENRMNDIRDALEGVTRWGALKDGFSVFRISLSHRREGLHVLAEHRARRSRTGKNARAAPVVRLAGRIEDLMVRRTEGPREYAHRTRAWIRDGSRLVAMRQSFESVVDALRDAIVLRLPGSRPSSTRAEMRVISLGNRQVGRFRHLGFEAAFRGATYCPLPEFERTGAYDNPFNDYLFSPYEDLFHWVALGEILEGHWNAPWVKVLHTSGKILTTGDTAHTFDRGLLEVSRDMVRVDASGALVVDDSVPQVANLDRAEAGNPHSPGWAGEAWMGDGDGDSGCGGN